MDLEVDAVPHGEVVRVPSAPLRLIVPLATGVVALRCDGCEWLVDRAAWAIVPRGRRASVEALSASCRLLFGDVHPPLEARVADHYGAVGLTPDVITARTAAPRILPRTDWVHEIAHRLLFERQVCGGEDNEATRFLETEILKELCFLVGEAEAAEAPARASRLEGPGDLVARARSFLEEELFAPWTLERLARRVGASSSTLLRTFKREVGQTPLAWWRARRLEEAMALLGSGRFTVSEVAYRIGYASPTVFADAFRRHFGHPPSQVGR